MTFSLEQMTLTLNGHSVTGWSDDTDALSLPSIDLSNIKRGASGEMVATTTGEKGGPVTIKLLPNSPSVKFFQNLITSIQQGGRVEFNGSIVDSVNGITVSLQRGVMQNAPLGPTIGKGEVANREYVIEFERVEADYSAANF